MSIAVAGSGISGMLAAYLLSQEHDVTLFERDARLGGHTNTVRVTHEGRELAVDTGFIVFNERNYPNFCRLLRHLGVDSRPTTMSFSLRDPVRKFEYGGSSLPGVVGPVSNLLRPRWWRVVGGVARLGGAGKSALAAAAPNETIADLARSGRISQAVLDDYMLPMAAAIWSAPREAMLDFPARFLLRFFDNHGMLDLRERPEWRTVRGGSCAYVQAMLPTLEPITRLNAPVLGIRRDDAGVEVRTARGHERFDHIVLATHADQALALLEDPSPEEAAILGAMPFQTNDTVLHTDARQLPTRRRCWAAWNYRLTGDSARPVSVTYNMSILQGLKTRDPLCVTLNDTDAIDPGKIIARFRYDHPLYSLEGDRARARWDQISGHHTRTHYCGAYWRNGFHEDGVVSALRVCEAFGVSLDAPGEGRAPTPEEIAA
ncbi:MAG: NAD(P)/FAD-dependent oxidoreductase [Phycisphaerales bacterium JB041]